MNTEKENSDLGVFIIMNEKRFKKMDTIIDPFPIWDTVEEKGYNCTDTLDVLVDLLNELNDERMMYRTTIDKRIVELEEENEQLRKDVENLQEVVAELGATLLINGFEIEINGENLSELIDDE